jgi:hypothetical protein
MQAGEQGSALRALLQSTAKVTAVSTPQQLLDAKIRGDAHIEIRQHLDLTTVSYLDASEIGVPKLLGYLPDSVKSIRVRYDSKQRACKPPRVRCMRASLPTALLEE